ncbi:MAG: scpB [Bacilli bacterium]|nr:scpB [Bacilli bacterium]
MNSLQTSFWKLLDWSDPDALDDTALKSIIEGLLFVAGNAGISLKQATSVVELPESELKRLLYELQSEYEQHKRGMQILEIAGAFQLATRSEHAPFFEKLAEEPQHSGLSQAALETLAIMAYRQPITRLDVEEIRGVKSERAIQTLVHKQLIHEVGRAQGPGRPILYGTTREFLDFFGLNDLSQLPEPSEELLMPAVQEEIRFLFSGVDSAAGVDLDESGDPNELPNTSDEE